MGCSNSKQLSFRGTNANRPGSPPTSPKKSPNRKDDLQDIGIIIKGEKKTVKITNQKSALLKLDVYDNKQKIPIHGATYQYNLSYCYAAQRGYYPNAPDKANQDSYLLVENLSNDPFTHLFGVFDGHGEYGDLCSYYAADQFAGNFENNIKARGGWSSFDNDAIVDRAYADAFVDTNKKLHHSDVDDSLSGTTGITILIRGDQLYIGNVGDSRAIIASENENGKLVYAPLSHDQTPFRKDERDRCKKAGAIVASLDQIEGYEPMHENWGTENGDTIDESGDPPRLWDSSEEKPGCAFTRSIGDAVAEDIGVYAEPEVLIWSLSPKDKFAVIASDGVFEFLTSQAVVDMVAKFTSPVDAAKYIVAEAYRLWLTYDERTDDITIIIISFDSIRSTSIVDAVFRRNDSYKVPSNKVTPRSARMNLPQDDLFNRPVRRILTGNRRRLIGNDDQVNRAELEQFTPREYPKTPMEIARIREMVKENFLFKKLEETQRLLIFKVMQVREVKPDEVIIKEGERGDDMYVVDSGEFVVYKKDEKGNQKAVFEYTNAGSAFGELSLMYSQPRAATVKARTAGKLWSIDRHSFRAILMRNIRGGSGLLELFKAIPIFETTSFPQVQRLCQSLEERLFSNGDIIYSPDYPTPKWILCLVVSGSVYIKPKVAGEHPMVREGNTYILLDEIKTLKATVTATSTTRLACLPKIAFDEVMGISGQQAMKAETRRKSSVRSKALERRLSTTNDPTKFNKLKVMKTRDHLVLENTTILCGDYGYIGCYKNKLTKSPCSLKVIAKKKAHAANADQALLRERQILTALNNMSNSLPRVVSTYQNDTIVILEYSDMYQSDLSTVLINTQLSEDVKIYYIACVYSAMLTLHDNAVLHRLINSTSVYITDRGVPVLADFRYAKRMDGSKSYTICGDPFYFAPEIVSNQGYDFAADLWAYGMFIFEIFEGTTLFGLTTDETRLFQNISTFNGEVKYTNETPQNVREVINGLLKPKPDSRLGYGNSNQIKETKLFKDIEWNTLGEGIGHPIDFSASVEVPSDLMDEPHLGPYFSDTFDQY